MSEEKKNLPSAGIYKNEGPMDKLGMINSVFYVESPHEDYYKRVATRSHAVTKTRIQLQNIASRKRWNKYGNATNKGEKGITSQSNDTVHILNTFSDEGGDLPGNGLLEKFVNAVSDSKKN